MSLSQYLRGLWIDLKMNNLDLSGNTTEFKTLQTRPRSHRYILIYIFAMESVKICRFQAVFQFNRISAKRTVFHCFVTPQAKLMKWAQ